MLQSIYKILLHVVECMVITVNVVHSHGDHMSIHYFNPIISVVANNSLNLSSC